MAPDGAAGGVLLRRARRRWRRTARRGGVLLRPAHKAPPGAAQGKGHQTADEQREQHDGRQQPTGCRRALHLGYGRPRGGGGDQHGTLGDGVDGVGELGVARPYVPLGTPEAGRRRSAPPPGRAPGRRPRSRTAPRSTARRCLPPRAATSSAALPCADANRRAHRACAPPVSAAPRAVRASVRVRSNAASTRGSCSRRARSGTGTSVGAPPSETEVIPAAQSVAASASRTAATHATLRTASRPGNTVTSSVSSPPRPTSPGYRQAGRPANWTVRGPWPRSWVRARTLAGTSDAWSGAPTVTMTRSRSGGAGASTTVVPGRRGPSRQASGHFNSRRAGPDDPGGRRLDALVGRHEAGLPRRRRRRRPSAQRRTRRRPPPGAGLRSALSRRRSSGGVEAAGGVEPGRGRGRGGLPGAGRGAAGGAGVVAAAARG